MQSKYKVFLILFLIIIVLVLSIMLVNDLNTTSNKGRPSPVQPTNSSNNQTSTPLVTEGPTEKVAGETNPEETSTPQPDEEITLSFAGDILLDRGVKRYINREGYDFVINEEVRKHFTSADIAMVNLENPFSNRGEPVPDKEWTFRADPEHFSLINKMGIDIVNVANNHVLDYGQDAFLDTLSILDDNDILYVGGGNNIKEAYSPKFIDVKNKKIAFLGANRVMPDMSWYATETRPGLSATYNPEKLIAEIEKVDPISDYVVVFVHWGVERQEMPVDYQKEMAKQYIDAGADIVIASHPHIMQGFEYYKGKPIAYSLGNFIFTDAAKDTAILKITLKHDDSISAQIVPCEIKSLRTKFMDENRIPSYFDYLESISFGVTIDDEGFIIMN